MQELPADWTALCVLVFFLGMRHGLDADHLAAIDGLTRLSRNRRFSRWCGALFSLGHGAIVLLISVSVGSVHARWSAPDWLGPTGAWISIGFLFLLGIANLRALWRTPRGSSVALVGIKSKRLHRLIRADHPFQAAGVGALFALSFDTISQAALFAFTAGRFGGVGHCVALGAVFVVGMLTVDGIGGWWMARLIARADAAAAQASRVMSGVVAGISLAVAMIGLARLTSPAVDRWADSSPLVIALLVVAAMMLAYGMSRWLYWRSASRRAAPETPRAWGARLGIE